MSKKPAPRQIVVDHTSALIRSMLTVSESLAGVEHNVSKGTLRELLVSGAVRHFLPSQLSVSSGIIVDNRGHQSRQTDVIVFDNRLLPPLAGQHPVSVVPAEAAIATIEVKSKLTEISATEEAALRLRRIYDRLDLGFSQENDDLRDLLAPLSYMFAFYGRGPAWLRDKMKGKRWLESKIQHLRGIVLAGQYSWMMVKGKWVPGFADTSHNGMLEETKRFFALLVDNARFVAENRYRLFTSRYRDWLGPYIRG